MSTIRVLNFGLGPIGAAIAKQLLTRPGFRIVGAVDIDPAKVGHDLADVVGLPRRLNVRVSGDAVKALKTSNPDVVVHCTSSSLKTVTTQLETLLKARVPVVSTTEELAYPMRTNSRLARRLDALARRARVAVLGTGVNPGFTMDSLAIMLTAACERVERITVSRVQDARIRRLPFQHKIGAGLTIEQFLKKVKDGSVRHVGFTESIAMIGEALGWRLERITDDVRPRLADTMVASDLLSVDQGYVCGIIQDGVGYSKGVAVIQLHLEAYLGAPESYDSIEIEGSPHLSMKISGGVHGDIATASIVINSIPKVLAAAPGLHTMRDLVLPSYFPG